MKHELDVTLVLTSYQLERLEREASERGETYEETVQRWIEMFLIYMH